MKTFARVLLRWQWVVLALLVVGTGVALYGVTLLRIDPSNARLFPRQGKEAQRYQQFLATFGSDEAILVALHDPAQSLLTPAGLAAIRRLTKELEELPHVATVHSLTNAPDMAQVNLTPFGLAVPRLVPDPEISLERRDAIRHNEQVLGTLLSTDSHTAGLLVVPDEASGVAHVRGAWMTSVRAVAARHGTQGRQTYVAGTLLERHDVTAYIQRDQQRIIPLVLLILLGVTYSIYRVRRFALLSLACVLISLTWTMGLVGFLGIPLHVITSLLPAVILVVSVSVSIHLVNQFIDEIDAGATGATAVENAVGHVGVACLLTAMTNAMGFFSLPVMQAPAIQEFGLFAGLGVLLSFVATMTFAPLMLLRLGQIMPSRLRHLKEGRLERFLERITIWVAQHRRWVALGVVGLVALMVPGVWQITEGTDMLRALKQDAPIRVSSEFIDQHLTGAHALEFLVQLPSHEDASAPATIRRVLAFSTWLRGQTGVTAVLSAWEPLRGVRAALLGDDEQLKILASLLPLGFPLDAWLDGSGTRLRISARVLSLNSEHFLALATRTEHQARAMALPAYVTGTHYLLAHMAQALVHNQVVSLLCASVMILGTITLALRSWKMGLVAALPNLLPTLMIFGLMGWCGIELSAATAMIASVALGLFVDDTIHLLYLYMQTKKAGHEPLAALAYAVHHAGRAVIFTSLILTLGFWAGLCGSFKPTLYFSFLMGLTMLFAVVTELLVTPAAVLAVEGSPEAKPRR